MSTKLFFVGNAAVDWSRGEGDADLIGTVRNWASSALRLTRGTAAASSTATSVTGPTNGIGFVIGTAFADFVTEPLDRDVTISGTVTPNIWCSESSMTANACPGVVIERLDSKGAVVSSIYNFSSGVEMGTSAAAQNFPAGPTSTNMLKGDRIRARVFFKDAGGVMAAGFTLTFRSDGPTSAADGDSYITFAEDFGFLQNGPGTSLDKTATGGGHIVGTTTVARIATKLDWPSDGSLTSVTLHMMKTGTPSDNVEFAIQADSAGLPSGTDLTSASVAGTSLSTTPGSTVVFNVTDLNMVGGQPYWLIVRRSGAGSDANYYQWNADSASNSSSGIWAYNGTWFITAFQNQPYYTFSWTPATSTLYLTDTASAVDPNAGYVAKEAWTSRGAGVLTLATSDAAGPTAPLPAGGANVAVQNSSNTSIVAPRGTGGTEEELAQSFVATADTLGSVVVALSKFASPTDDIIAEIRTDSSGVPSSTVLASGTITNAAIGIGSQTTRILFSNEVTLSNGTTYWLVLRRSGSRDASNYFMWQYQSTDVATGVRAIRNSGTWTAQASASGDHRYTTTKVYVEWFTRPLTAFTLSGLIACNIRARENNSASNATMRVEIAVCATDGTSPTVWGAANDGVELGAPESAWTWNIAGDDIAVTNGQRLRIRIYFDDAPGLAMASVPSDFYIYYAGTSGGASGDTFITLPQAVTEYVTSAPIPPKALVGNFAVERSYSY